MGHPRRSLHHIRAPCSNANNLYEFPSRSSVLPVYEDITFRWNPDCVDFSASNIDIYLSVEGDRGLNAVHIWSGVPYSTGRLDVQLEPRWWNASTGAGQVQGNLAFVPEGNQIWDTVAPSSALFSITYNGTYPASLTETSGPQPTGPSVTSVKQEDSGKGLSSGKLVAAILVPLLLILFAILGYVAYHKRKKKPEKKRWSAVIDHRMSMISNGTAPIPRHSLASRPNSTYSELPPGGAPYQRSPLANASDGRPASVVSRPSLAADRALGSSPMKQSFSGDRPNSTFSGSVRPSPSSEMRQVGGKRISRISFAGTENRKSRTSGFYTLDNHSGSLSKPGYKPSALGRYQNTSTTELSLDDYPALRVVQDPEVLTPNSRPLSAVSYQRDTPSPFADTSLPVHSRTVSATSRQQPHMPMMQRGSVLNPDDMLSQYAATSAPSESTPRTSVRKTESGVWGRLMKGWKNSTPTPASPTLDESSPSPSTQSSPSSSAQPANRPESEDVFHSIPIPPPPPVRAKKPSIMADSNSLSRFTTTTSSEAGFARAF